ncbi:MAG: ATP-binding cassette domain-containing protein [Desulfobacula sp.]|nr:ATP-binding cassette domain-containing protein [Desulfobacula sp.]
MTVPLIQFIDVEKRFGTHQVLKGLNLSIYTGEIIAVIGKSGTGKSVLLKHIIGLVHQDSGQILIEGEPLHQLSVKKIRSFQNKLSYMFQDNALFDFLNIYDNIALPLVENSKFSKIRIKEKVMTRINQLGLMDAEEKFPAQLSGGMRKRVALARALVTDPKIVLFDEPTSGLDPVRKKNVHSMIQEYQEKFGFTAVIVSHDIPQIFDIAQRIALLDDGVIKFEGSQKDILESHSTVLNAFIRGDDVPDTFD